jgi:hypothetical protein
MARTATPVMMEMSRRFMGRLSVRSARRKFCATATSSSGWRRRAEIEVVLSLQLVNDGCHVDKLRLHRLHFRFDPVNLHVKLFSPLYGRILTALVPRRLGSFCSVASISDAASFGLCFADIGATISVAVSARNRTGSTIAESTPTAPVNYPKA